MTKERPNGLPIPVDYQKVVEQLSMRVAALVSENVMLSNVIQQLVKKGEEDESNGKKSSD